MSLPMHGKLPIPWVARYTGEHPTWPEGVEEAQIGTGVTEDGQEVGFINIPGCHRDDEGWLWQYAPNDRQGKPEFAMVHPERQRLCMDELLCQVCGEFTGEPSTWLVPPWEMPHHPSLPIQTTHAPVCVDCVQTALTYCPHLRDSSPDGRS